jgi:hypothetical protein
MISRSLELKAANAGAVVATSHSASHCRMTAVAVSLAQQAYSSYTNLVPTIVPVYSRLCLGL